MALEQYYLHLAYHLALQNAGKTSPNPAVGAIVVRGDQIAGYGSHEKAGEPHAEIVALNRAADRARNATLFCSLEPCAHQGKTPPCVEAICAAGVKRVVYAAQDQNPLVSGKGADALRQSGVEVQQILVPAIESFYAPFFQTFRAARPYVIAKVGMTLNGIISPADRNSHWITNESSLAWVHQLRAQCDGILVGADTVLLDNPRLTVRAEGINRSPLRIVVDARLKLDPEECSLLESEGPILICGSENASSAREKMWHDHGVNTLRFRTVHSLLNSLLELGLRKIVVEGGQKIFTLFHSAGLIDEYVLMIAPRLLTGRHFLNFLGGPEQSLLESRRYSIAPMLDLDGDLIVRFRRPA